MKANKSYLKARKAYPKARKPYLKARTGSVTGVGTWVGGLVRTNSGTGSSATTPEAEFTMPDNPVEVKAVFEEIPSPILLPQLASGNKAVPLLVCHIPKILI